VSDECTRARCATACPLNASRLAAEIFRARAIEAGVLRVGYVEASVPDANGHVRVTGEVTIDAADIAELAEVERIALAEGASS
jgi:hypothetical protein